MYALSQFKISLFSTSQICLTIIYISQCGLVPFSSSDYKSSYTFKALLQKTNHNKRNKTSFWMTGRSLGKHPYLQDKPQFAAANRLHGAPYGVDKYSHWGCCAVIREAQKEARRRLLAVLGVYRLPVKIIACSADLQSHSWQSLLAQNAVPWEPS